jgi:predicted SAM-dependent methyltransferase
MDINSFKRNRAVKFCVKIIRNIIGISGQDLNHNFHKKRAPALIKLYLENNSVRKLQIGAQSNSIAGWINVDILPKSVDIIYMDATKRFPFPSDSIDYIYTEHMIEHISFSDAKLMLSECFRVMKKKGKIRISTPDLLFLISLYQQEKTPVQREYIAFSVNRYLRNNTPSEDTYVINNFFKDWGHQFIHDYRSLQFLLMGAGFKNVKRHVPMESDDVNLCNIEQHGKEIGFEFNALESIIVQAEKL